MEKIQDIEPIDLQHEEKCRFMDAECDEKMYIDEIASRELHLKWCQNCLMGKLIVELRRLRLTGLQP